MSRAIAWRHQGGGAHGHVFVWPTLGTGGQPLTTLYRPWRLYGRKGGAHGSLFVWHAEGSAGAGPAAGRKLISQALAATIQTELT
jgi:hypothetical protein